MEAVGRRGKKRKAPCHLCLEPQGEGEGGNDLISSLPEAILSEIISLLPTSDGARTQALASQWRHIWRSAPMNLDHNSLPADVHAQVSLISQILAEHHGPVYRFAVPAVYLQNYHTIVNTWLRSPTLDVLQELNIDPRLDYIPFYRFITPSYPLLPRSAFRFGATLRVATISMCEITLNMVEMPHFPQLRQLGLENVIISNNLLHRMIVSCPVLECLLLKLCYGFGSISITSSTVVSIGLSVNAEIIIEDAPKLEKLLQLDRCTALRLSVISAPKLNSLGCLTDGICFHSNLTQGATVIQMVEKGFRLPLQGAYGRLHAVTITSMIRSVRALAIIINNLRVDNIINLLRCFPCLQKLYIKTSNASGDIAWCHPKYPDVIRCLDNSLKEVILQDYQATEFQINFAKYLILNAKTLEIMKFQSRSRNINKSILEQRRLLQLEKRASVGARFQFLINECVRPSHIKHVGDLSKADPFECTC